VSTLLCVPILAPDTDIALREAHAAKDGGADMVEFRVDDIFHGYDSPTGEEAVAHLIDHTPLPCIITCRAASEGGHYDGPDDARISLYQRLGTALGVTIPPRYIDVELSTYQRSANIQQKVHLAVGYPDERRDLQTSLILSTHDFKGRPQDLARRILAMRSIPAAKVLKIAYLARSLRDNLELFDLLADRDRPTIALAMGEPGLISRILAPKFGGFLTFASLRPTTTTAPGQPTIHELLHTYRFRSIDKDTAVYGVVGHPVSHSLSPHIHNAGFDAIGLNAVYLPLPIAAGYESFKASVLELIHYTPLNLRGLSVTLPHKQNLIRLAQEQGWELDEVSTAVGAANTVAIDRDTANTITRIRTLNTDARALVSTLEQEIGPVAGKRIAIRGAGGVGKSAAISLAAAGASVTVFNRTYDRAAALAESLDPVSRAQIAADDLGNLTRSRFDAYINCTPLGMKDGPAPDGSPLPIADIARLAPGATIMDTIYNPLETPMLRAARESGLRPISGLPMFIAQAAAQFTAWTSQPAPAQLFDRIAREQLAAP
jgi:3-dehydroquinate dehydratase/shikimate dehydrogenase